MIHLGILFLVGIGSLSASFTKTYEHLLSANQRGEKEIVWEQLEVSPYNEAIVSWNGLRPITGKWTLFVSLRQEEWSPWLKYAEWTPTSQKTFKDSPEDSFAETYQDGANPKTGTCDAIRVKLIAEEGADLSELDSLYICLSHLPDHRIIQSPPLFPIFLPNVPRQSQMTLNHPRHRDLCSPTSTTNAINYLLGLSLVDPIFFASKIHDDEFDIYGNWILNTAEVYGRLNGAYRAHVERLQSFEDLYAELYQGRPVVVSVKGTLPGAPQPYRSGHLICIIGYEDSSVICIDPAFPDNDSTFTRYPLDEFLQAWGRRYNIAYLFAPRS